MMQFQDQIILWLHLQLPFIVETSLFHPSNNDKVSGKCPDLNGNYISFLSLIFTAAVTDVGFIIAFCNFNSAKWNENDSKKKFHSLISQRPTKDTSGLFYVPGFQYCLRVQFSVRTVPVVADLCNGEGNLCLDVCRGGLKQQKISENWD